MAPLDTKTRLGFQNILFATDFSASAEVALPHAVALARRFDAKLYLAHILPRENWQVVPSSALPPAFDLTRHQAERRVSKLLRSDRLRGISQEVVLEEGRLGEVLPAMIEKRDIDLVVISTHGRKGFRKLLLGSKAEEILHAAKCPVLIVGPRASRASPTEFELRNILFATDLTPQSLNALPYALLLARGPRTHLTLVNVVEELSRAHLRDPNRVLNYMQGRLRELVPAEARLSGEPDYLVEFGPAVEGILHVAEQQRADVIVVGERRPGAFSTHLLGDTAYEVVCQAHCPVLAVRA